MSPAQSNTLSGARYTSVAIFLHWIMAVGILALLVLGLTMTHVTLPLMRKFQLYQLHKSIGVTILLAAFASRRARGLSSPAAPSARAE